MITKVGEVGDNKKIMNRITMKPTITIFLQSREEDEIINQRRRFLQNQREVKMTEK